MEKINGRTPEEIKRILSWINFDCSEHECDSCPNEDICSLQNGNESVLAKDALDLILHLEAQQPKWISVKEMLPEPEQKVLLLTEEKVTRYTKWRSVTCGFYEDGNVWSEDSKASWEHCMLVDYDEERDDFRVPEGWIEEGIAERDDYNCAVISNRITHWMPLPEPPKEDE